MPDDALIQAARPEITAALARGVQRLLGDHGLASILEVPLSNGRRADVMALDAAGAIWIVETKSGLPDFESDAKWPEYLAYCDAFYFAVPPGFPLDRIDTACGLIVADGFGGEILRPPTPPAPPLAPARRKALTLAFARLAAARLHKA